MSVAAMDVCTVMVDENDDDIENEPTSSSIETINLDTTVDKKSIDNRNVPSIVRRSSSSKKASPFGQMLDAVRKEAEQCQLWSSEMQHDLPKRWEKHGQF